MKISTFIKPWGNVAVNAAFTYPQMRQDIELARREHRSVMWAGAKSAVKNNWMAIVTIGASRPGLMMLGFMALEAAPALVNLGAGIIRERNDAIRLAATPFSQRFEHTDWTWRSQQRGMQAISGARSMIGSEAGAFARRYGRR